MFTTQHANAAPVIYGVPGSNGASCINGPWHLLVGGATGMRIPGYITPVSREVGAEFPDCTTEREGKTIAMMQCVLPDAFAANTAVSLVINRYDPASHGDCYRVGRRETVRISLPDISAARGRNNIYPPGKMESCRLV